MTIFTIMVLDKDKRIICSESGVDVVSLVCNHEYQEGDHIILESTEKNIYVKLQLDDAMGSSLCYLTGNLSYVIPFGEKKISYSPKAFSGSIHYLFVKVASKEEVCRYQNLACNVYDRHGDTHCYPHAFANVETRGESVFAARNAIDGVCENRSHGEWPYQSWGINQRADAEMTVDFGREVEVDKLVLYTRADFPHDSWWKQVTFTFSDGSTLVQELEKSIKPHILQIKKRRINWVKLSELIKADDPSPFPALSQIEVYGRDVMEKG